MAAEIDTPAAFDALRQMLRRGRDPLHTKKYEDRWFLCERPESPPDDDASIEPRCRPCLLAMQSLAYNGLDAQTLYVQSDSLITYGVSVARALEFVAEWQDEQ